MSPTQRISEVIPWTKASWGWGPNTEISEEIPWTKQVGVEAPTTRRNSTDKSKLGLGPNRNSTDKSKLGLGKTGDNEFYPSLAFILIRGILQVDKRDNYRQC